jgi:hypothetical protein
MSLGRRQIVVLIALALLLAAGGYYLGVRGAERANWHTATVSLSGVVADETGPHRLVSFRVDGWTYAVEDSVRWVDPQGTTHESGWPQCLEPAHPGFSSRNDEEVTFRFAELTADTGYLGWRPVLMVECPGA